MIEAIEVKAACNGILRTLYPNMKIYGPDTTGALERPSFYTELIPYLLEYQTVNLVKQRIGFKISLMEEVTNEEFELSALANIRQGFGLKLKIGKRRLTVSDVEFEYTGAKNDVFQITVTIEWYDTITETKDYDLMQDVDVDTVVKGE
jgi:hypothetical protein